MNLLAILAQGGQTVSISFPAGPPGTAQLLITDPEGNSVILSVSNPTYRLPTLPFGESYSMVVMGAPAPITSLTVTGPHQYQYGVTTPGPVMTVTIN